MTPPHDAVRVAGGIHELVSHFFKINETKVFLGEVQFLPYDVL